jgi:hypothetical protein
MQWLPPQHALHQDGARVKQLRLGNQWGGKTTAGLVEIDWWCTGRHPHLETRRPPVEAWVVCASWSQSVAIQKKFWELCSKEELDPRTVFDDVKGFRGKNPVIRYTNGSIVRFKTTRQGGLNLASATIDVALLDEPTAQRVFEELRKRLLRRRGTLILTFTPINAPVEYLRELAEVGKISDHHFRLEARHLIPVGATEPMLLDDGTPMDADWIAEVRSNTLAREEPIVVDGEWETRVEGRLFRAFDSRVGGRHVVAELPPNPDLDLDLAIGIDHGWSFKQVAVLVGLDRSADGFPHVYVLDEYVGEGETTEDHDAAGILSMLQRWGVSWGDLVEVRGDKPYEEARVVGPVGRKSNADLMRALRTQLRLKRTAQLVPPIRQAKTGKGGGRGSIDRGCTWLHRAMVRDRFTVLSRCERLIGALERWDYTDSDEKDPIDALRYSTWRWAMRGSSFAREGREATVYVY